MSPALERFAELLGRAGRRVVWNGGRSAFKFSCVIHDDRAPSADATTGDRVPVVASCQVCGTAASLPVMLDELDASDEDRDLILGGEKRRSSETNGAGANVEVIHHDYRDPNGVPVLRVVRHLCWGKTIKLQRQYFHAGEWRWPSDLPEGAKPDTKKILYNAPEVIAAARAGEVLYLGEGERVVDALVALGYPATCNAGGASKEDYGPKWTMSHADQIRGAAGAVIFEDNDRTGRAHRDAEAATLSAVGVPEIRVVSFPDLPKKSDLVDWLKSIPVADRRARLDELIAKAPLWTSERDPEKSTVEYLDLAQIRAKGIPAVDWIVPGWLAAEDVALISGDGGIGKSTTAAALALAIAAGGKWCGTQVTKPGPVLVFDEEQSPEELADIYLRLGAPHRDLRVAAQQGLSLVSADGVARIEAELAAHRPALVIFDSVQQLFAGVELKDDGAVAKVFATLFRLRRDYRAAFALIGHLRKPPADGNLARAHLVFGSVAFQTQSSTVWVATQPAKDLLDLVQTKRRRGEKASMRVRYQSDGPGAPIVLISDGPVEEVETTVERAQRFVVDYLAGKGPMSTAMIVAAAAAGQPPLVKISVERALKDLVRLKAINRTRRGVYEIAHP